MDAVHTASSPVSTIPFSQPAATPMATSAGGLLIAGALLGVAFVVLWWLRRRGYGVGTSASAVGTQSDRLAVTQRLRLSPTCQAFVVVDGQTRLLVVESRHGVQINPLPQVESAA
jgi:hypothetical protein